jgi:tRNA-specific 2-thiouridylase
LLEDTRAQVRLHEPQKAVAPGQAAVFYYGDIVLGGGWICRAEPARRHEAAILA